jgi:hypothetical protein
VSVPITTPAHSPASNDLAGAVVRSFTRDVSAAELLHAESVLLQPGRWFANYDTESPHAALRRRSPKSVGFDSRT